MVAASLIAAATTAIGQVAAARASDVRDESFFIERVYPVLQAVQCERCHSDNGVASGTLLEFPDPDADEARIEAFGLSMIDLVDPGDPLQSLLLTKPTRRIDHTGGRRIRPDSDEEALLLDWVTYLAGLTEDEVRQAREKIARAEPTGLETLTVRRLTHSQYNHTVRDLLGDLSQPANGFPKEDFINGFRNQVEGQGVSPLQAEAYGKAAERLALAAFRGGDHHGLIPRQPESPTDAEAAEEFVRRFGLRAFRRPLDGDEVGRYREMFLREAGRTQDFHRGASIVIETMLQSPYFLFRIEGGADGPNADYEVASRLSYLLWDTMPSDELFRAAAEGELSTPGRVEGVARRLLDDPRARSAMDEFLAQWLRFDRVLDATKDRRRFREYNAEVAAAMVEETRLLFNELAWNDRDFREIFTADYTFVSSELARLYDLTTPESEFAKVSYPPDSGRSGVLGHGSFLVATSNPAETSPTARGLFVRNHFLGQEVPPPPAGVDTNLPVVTEAAPMTNRERLAVHLNSESCASCHRLIDPIGLGFEQYNAIGAYQETLSLQFRGGRGDSDRGRGSSPIELEIDTSGYIQGIEDSSFSTPKELGLLLAESETCQRSIAKQFFRYAFGRQETANDQAVIDGLYAKFRASGFRFRELIVALVTSELFLQRGAD
ncbi:DUF1592 domain-containing protein [Tautonia plasticadhaerens]|nr:DUF1592 domain-containing protein [Tautonia plasticadhaerens]